MIPAGFLQDLLSRVDIVDVVTRHVELRRSGANLVGLCPFHAEKSPSFSVSPVKQFYHCFGCGAGGDAIRFLTEHTGMSFVEAVEELAQSVGLQVPQEEVSPQERQRRQKLAERRLTLGELMARAAAYYRSQLREAPAAVAYLKARGLTGQVAARFGLGYAPPGWRSLAGVFPDYDDPLLEEAGLVRSAEAAAEGEAAGAERRRYDWFRHRVMFPIRGAQGEVIGFGGRVLDDSKPKYINSPETPLFSKGRELYGLHEARQAIRERGQVLVVEGYMDVVALAQHGFAQAVATLGTACTPDHVHKLFRHTDAVIFSFDGDAAGRRAAARALEAALPYATDLRQIRFLFLPPEHDPDSYVRERGVAAFAEAVDGAVPLSRQLVEQAAEGTESGTAEGRARFLAQARPLWSALPDGALRRQVFAELARHGQMALEDLAALWQGQPPAPGAAGAPPRARPRLARPFTASRPAPAASADLALRLLLRHAAWWERLSASDHELLHGLGGLHGEIVAWLERQLTEHGPQPWSTLEEALRGQPLHEAALRVADPASIEDQHGFDDLARVVNRLWAAYYKDQATAKAADARNDPEHLAEMRHLYELIAHHTRLAAVTAGGGG